LSGNQEISKNLLEKTKKKQGNVDIPLLLSLETASTFVLHYFLPYAEIAALIIMHPKNVCILTDLFARQEGSEHSSGRKRQRGEERAIAGAMAR